jgi:hypothetical protein
VHLASEAEAKLVRYEINGQIYSYSTNNHQQTREARRRIAAAKAAEAVKQKAAAELAANPLARLFGSPTQREAAEAQARLQQSVAPQQQAEVDTTNSVRRSQRRAKRTAERTRTVRQVRARPVKVARLKEAPVTPSAAVRGAQADVTPPRPQAQPSASARLEAAQPHSEAPFIPLTPPPKPVGNSLTDFVNQVRTAPAQP